MWTVLLVIFLVIIGQIIGIVAARMMLSIKRKNDSNKKHKEK